MSNQPIIVCKFGGSSLASASQIRKAESIIKANPNRRYVINSAPGKRDDGDQKITDLLYLCHEHATRGLPFEEVFSVIASRFQGIADELELQLDLSAELSAIKASIAGHGQTGQPADYAASRGEYLNGKIMAALLGWRFIDAAGVIFFNAKGDLDNQRSYDTLAEKLAGQPAVIPGFYGSTPDGRIKTFSRGGSDITGSIVARALHADSYENWTDVPGLFITDPRVVPGAYSIEIITYQELRELSYSGAAVLHEDAVFPVREAGIPVRIRDTNDPGHPGTVIVPRHHPEAKKSYLITGIAGRKDFTVIQIEKPMMNKEVGFGRRVLQVLEDHEVSFEHMPSGIDTLSVVIAASQIGNKLDVILQELAIAVQPESISVTDKMALLTVVGRGMAHYPGLAARALAALGAQNINVRMIDSGCSQMNLIVGVDVERFEDAVRAIYAAFVHDGETMHGY